MEFVQIGVVDVDAGLIMIGDPVYTLPDGASRRSTAAKEWEQLCGEVDGKWYAEPFGAGAALVIRTLHGDGEYPVMAEVDEHGSVRRLILDLELPDAEWSEDEDEDDFCCHDCGTGHFSA